MIRTVCAAALACCLSLPALAASPAAKGRRTPKESSFVRVPVVDFAGRPSALLVPATPRAAAELALGAWVDPHKAFPGAAGMGTDGVRLWVGGVAQGYRAAAKMTPYNPLLAHAMVSWAETLERTFGAKPHDSLATTPPVFQPFMDAAKAFAAPLPTKIPGL